MSERKSVLITGASRGIGAATARLFARQGYGVGIHYHTAQARAQALAEELRELGVPVGLYPCDVSRPGEVREMTAAFLRDFDTSVSYTHLSNHIYHLTRTV